MKKCVVYKQSTQVWIVAVQQEKRIPVIHVLDYLEYIEEAYEVPNTKTYLCIEFSWIAEDSDKAAVVELLENQLDAEVEFIELALS